MHYAAQLAEQLRIKTDELNWLLMEAEARLALSREWTEEARAAGDPQWATRYTEDIELLEASINHIRTRLRMLLG
jgi:hypothetical protein